MSEEKKPQVPETKRAITSVQVNPVLKLTHITEEKGDFFEVAIVPREGDGVCSWDEETDEEGVPTKATFYLKRETALSLAIQLISLAGLEVNIADTELYAAGFPAQLLLDNFEQEMTFKTEFTGVPDA